MYSITEKARWKAMEMFDKPFSTSVVSVLNIPFSMFPKEWVNKKPDWCNITRSGKIELNFEMESKLSLYTWSAVYGICTSDVINNGFNYLVVEPGDDLRPLDNANGDKHVYLKLLFYSDYPRETSQQIAQLMLRSNFINNIKLTLTDMHKCYEDLLPQDPIWWSKKCFARWEQELKLKDIASKYNEIFKKFIIPKPGVIEKVTWWQQVNNWLSNKNRK